jgi:signal transduction histidine kinase
VGPQRVLVIDDEEVSRISCQRILRRIGIETTLSSRGREGLDTLMREPHDLVLVDLKMPEMDGLEVARRVREFDASIVTIIITGFATIETAVMAIKEGAYDYLPKPFTPDELVIVVQRGLEKRRLDQQSRALREEKQAMERNFITMVTHQLRSPLAAIYQYFEVLLSDIGGGLTEMQREMIERAGVRLEGLLQLINDWLDMNRIQTGDIVHRLQVLPVSSCVDAGLAGLEMAAADKNIRIDVNLPPDLPEIEADADTLREVLANLISNAIKYNKPGGEVHVRAHTESQWVVIEVEDSGLGLEEKEIPFIFEQFYRSKDPAVREQQGTGLGLTIVQKIVRAHGGKIEVRSRLGKGSTFLVYLNKAGQGTVALQKSALH